MFKAGGTFEHNSRETDGNARNRETVELALQLTEQDFERAHRPGRFDLVDGVTQSAWKATDAAAQMASFDYAILVNKSETIPLQYAWLINPGQANQDSGGGEIPPNEFRIINGTMYSKDFAQVTGITFQAGGPDGFVEEILVEARGGAGAYAIYLFGN